MANESNRQDNLSTLIAVLIALLSLAGAIVAWRVAGAASAAGDADAKGLLAAVDAEDAKTDAKTTVLGHLLVYARAVQNEVLKSEFDALAAKTDDTALKTQLEHESEVLDATATRDRDFLPDQYLDREQGFDAERDYGETLANNARQRDVVPDAHFAAADAFRAKTEYLLAILVFLGIAFVLLTLADAVRNRARYFLLFGGFAILVFGSLAAFLVEVYYWQ